MIASHVTGKRVVAGLFGLAIATMLWRLGPLLEPDVEAEASPSYTYVPLSGDPLDRVVDDLDGDIGGWNPPPAHPAYTTCLPFYAPLLTHPHWEIQIVRGASSCTTDGLRDSFTVDTRGRVTWWRARRPLRTLELTPAELAQIRTLDQLDCVRTEEVGYGEAWYRVSVGGDREGRAGAHISASSLMGKALDHIFDAAIARYQTRRLAELGGIRADVRASSYETWSPRTARYHLELVDHHLTVRYGKRLLVERDLDDDALVDLADSVLSPLASELEIRKEPSDDPSSDSIRGTFSAGGRAAAIYFTPFDYTAMEPLARGISDAYYEIQKGR